MTTKEGKSSTDEEYFWKSLSWTEEISNETPLRQCSWNQPNVQSAWIHWSKPKEWY